MAFITSHNAYKIVHRNNLKSANLTGEIYKWKIYILSKYEEQSLLAIQELMKNPEKYFTDIYNPIYVPDSKKFVYKEQQPAYHQFDDCERLLADYSNIELPQEIKERGDAEIERFRNWFKENSYDLGKDPVRFSMRMQLAFKISINPKSINYDNSGSTNFSNVSIAELENSIDNLLRESGRFYYASEKNTSILYQFGKISSIAFTENPLKCNNTNYSDDEVKEFLKEYHRKFKIPLKNLLIKYYQVKLNPQLKFSENLLEALGLKLCSCCKKRAVETSEIENWDFALQYCNDDKKQSSSLENTAIKRATLADFDGLMTVANLEALAAL